MLKNNMHFDRTLNSWETMPRSKLCFVHFVVHFQMIVTMINTINLH